MHDDLQHAKASVDWAEAKLPSFKKRLDAWLKENIHVVTKEMPPDTPNNVVVAMEKSSFPLSFQVEAGVYINTIRSSLDILASTLADRHCKALIDDAYFPIIASETIFRSDFASGKGFKGAKFVQALPAKERAIIESLKPYKGGNGLLWPLHQLDIVRKHVRLLTVEIQPRQFTVSGWGNDSRKYFIPIAIGWMRSGHDETVIGLVPKNATQKPQINLAMQVSLDETTYLPHREVIGALYDFAKLTRAVIRNFG
jgi:hypothetical protein